MLRRPFILFLLLYFFLSIVLASLFAPMDPIDHLSGCGTIDDGLHDLFEENHVDLDAFWAQFSPPSTPPDTRHSSHSFNVTEMTGEDLSLVEAWLADEGEGARAGDGQRRQVDAGDGPRAGGGALAQGGAGGARGVGEDPPRPGNNG